MWFLYEQALITFFFLNYSLICFQYIHFILFLFIFKCVYVWGFYETSDCWWLTVFRGKNHCQTVFDPLTSHADVLRLVTATEQVLAFFLSREHQSKSVRMHFPTLEARISFLPKSERSLSFPTRLVFWSTCWQISQHQAKTWNKINLDSREFLCVALIHLERTSNPLREV